MSLRPALVASILLGMTAVSPTYAGPPEVVAALKETPASLFELSLARLESLVQADGVQGDYYGWVTLQDEQIQIYTWSLSAPPTDEACEAILHRLKRLAAVDPATGFPDDPASRFATFFTYAALDTAEVDPTYHETVDSMIHLKAVIGVAGDGQAVICQGPLLSGEVSFTRE